MWPSRSCGGSFQRRSTTKASTSPHRPTATDPGPLTRPGAARADWGAQRVKGLSLKRAVMHAVKDLLSSDFQKRQEERETSLITRFFYPKLGPGQMWETVAAELTKGGGSIRFGHRVVGVITDG